MSGPPPLPYRHPSTPVIEPWSPTAVTIATTGLASLATGVSFFVSVHLAAVFDGFKIELPLTTRITVWVSNVIWNDFGWIPMILAAIAVPPLAIPRLPVPADESTRVWIRRFTRLLLTAVYLCVMCFVVISVFSPLIALINSVSGPQKK